MVINTEIGKEVEVMEHLASLESVECIYIVYGVYDIVAKVTSTTSEQLDSTIMNQIRQVPFVRSTLTLIVSKEYKRT